MEMDSMRGNIYNTKTRENILNCSMELIKERGYKNVTVNEICKQAGITKTTFYYHFASKEALLEDFTVHIGHIAEKNLTSILVQETFSQQICEIFTLYCTNDINVGHEIVKQIFISKLTSGQEKDFPNSAYLYPTVVNLVAKAQSAGEITNTAKPELITHLLYQALRGQILTWATENGSFDLVEIVKMMINTILSPNSGFELV